MKAKKSKQICHINLRKYTILRSGRSVLMVFRTSKYSPAEISRMEAANSKFNILLCKSDSGYQTLTSSDIMSWNLVQDNMDMLAACPLDDILE
jgi:hypothetical protein